MARADAGRHRLRTVLATLLVAVPIAGLMLAAGWFLGDPPPRAAALRSVPSGAQAVVAALARPQGGPAVQQAPVAIPAVIPDGKVVPVPTSTLTSALPSSARLTPYWTSADLLAAGVATDPFAAGAAAPETVMSLRLREADPELVARMVSTPTAGRIVSQPGEVVVSSAVADRLQLAVGLPLTLVGPPPTGWMGVGGPLDQLVAATSRTYTVVGVVDSDAAMVWATPGWISAAVERNPQGISRSYVVDGPDPVTWAQVKRLNAVQAAAVSRDVLEHYPAASELYPAALSTSELATLAFSVILSGVLGLAALLFLVTPAFTVSAEQSRRTLALASAAGAAPADLRRTVQAQGVVIGALGGVVGAALGVAGGLAANAMRRPGEDIAGAFPWGVIAFALAAAVALGVAAAMPPARWVVRHDVWVALTGTPVAGSSPRTRFRTYAGPLLVAFGVAVGGAALKVPLVTGSVDGPGGPAPLGIVGVIVALVLVYAGALASVTLLLRLAARLGRDLPVGARLALGDAVQRPRRAWPAVAAVLTCVLLATTYPVLRDSAVAEGRDRYPGFAAPGRLVAGPKVPVSASFDAAAIGQAVRALEPTVGPITRHPLSSWDIRHPSHPVVSPVRTCPGDTTPTLESSLSTANPLTCDLHRFSPGQSSNWRLGGEAYVMDGAAMRATGMPGSAAAAAVLDRGGVVVASANNLTADGRATVSRGIKDQAVGWLPDPATSLTFEAGLVPLYGPPLVLSPAAAARLGLADQSYVGEILETAHPVTAVQLIRARADVERTTTLVSLGAQQPELADLVSGALIAMVLVAAAVAATTTSLALARTQSLRDAATMEAVGATPSWVRRFSLVQAGVLLAAGLPLGALLGLALSAYVVRFNGAVGPGHWRQIVVPWPELVLGWSLVAVAALGAAWVLGRGTTTLVRRGLD